MPERRKINRRDFSYYMRVMNEATGDLVGHLVDISTGGFKLDCRQPVPLNQDFRLHIDLTSEVANKNFLVFVARSRWCDKDHIDPTSYNVGFQIISMSPGDLAIFNRMFELYGSDKRGTRKSDADYLWR